MKKLAYIALAVLTLLSILVVASGCSKALASPTDWDIDENYNLTWEPVKGARSYILEITDVAAGTSQNVTLRKTNHSLEDLKQGDYELRLKSVAGLDNAKDSDWSEIIFFEKGYESGLIYNLINNNTEYQVTKVGKAEGHLVIDDIYRGKPVTVIAEAAFRPSLKVESVVVGNNIKTIGAYAFYNATTITSVTLPESLRSIAESAFQGSGLTSVKLPNSITSISASAFAYCKSLKEVTLGNRLTVIGAYAFADCDVLETVSFPDTLRSIGTYAFSGNPMLTSVTFGSNLSQIGGYAFFRCFGLNSVNFNENSSLENISYYAFSECTSLTEIKLPEGLNSLGDYAFNKSEKLASVYVPESLTHVGAFAFNGTEIFQTGFNGDDYFIYVGRWIVGLAKKFQDYTEDNKSTDIGVTITPTMFRDDVVGLADQLFVKNSLLKQIEFPSSLKYIGNFAFFENTVLWKVNIPKNSVEHLGVQAFAYCSLLSNLILGEGVQTIGSYCFFSCKVLANNSISGSLIPESVVSIGQLAFGDTKIWETPDEYGVIYAGNWIVGYNGEVTDIMMKTETRGISDYAFANCETLSTITGAALAETVEYIGIGAFGNCKSLSAVTLNPNLRRIELLTFYNCASLLRVTMPINLEYIGSSAFYGCKILSELDLSASRVETIESQAFFSCNNLMEINLGNDLKSIGALAFYKCISLTNLVIPDSVLTVGNRAFSKCVSLESVTIGSSVVTIDDFAFSSCEALRNIEIPDSVRSIGAYAFFNCGTVEQLSLGEGVETIGDYAFYGLVNLKNLVFPESLVSIGNFAFRNCVGLTSVFINETITQIGSHAFYGCRQLTFYTNADDILGSWDTRWNSSFRPVVLNVGMSEDNSYVVSVTVEESSILNVNNIVQIGAPERYGYVFLGWSADSAATVAEIETEKLADVPAGTTLYAVWAVIETE